MRFYKRHSPENFNEFSSLNEKSKRQPENAESSSQEMKSTQTRLVKSGGKILAN